MRRSLALVAALAALMAPGVAGAARAATIMPGDLLVTDFVNQSVVDVNPATGAGFTVAGGFTNPQGLAIDAQGHIFVSDIGTSTIYQVNPTTGAVTPFSGGGVGNGPALNRPFEMQAVGGTLYVAEGGVPNGNTTAVYAIDAQGNRTLVAGNNGTANNLFDRSLAGVAVAANGTIFASSPTAGSPAHLGTIYTVGANTATPLTSAITATQGLAFGPNGQLLAVSGGPTNPSIWSINPANGDVTTLADNNGIGTGPAFGNLRGITYIGGSVYVTDLGASGIGQIDRVDPLNGNRTVVAGNGVGGTTFGQLSYGIAAYPSLVPEPSSVVLLVLGAGGAVLLGRRRAMRTAA